MDIAYGFFQGRRPLELDNWQRGGQLIRAEYLNLPRTIATVLSARMATIVELDTALGTQDLYDLLEVIAVDNYNRSHANDH